MPIIFGDASPEPSDVGIYGTAIAVGYLFLRVAEWGLTWLYKWWTERRTNYKADTAEERANRKQDESETVAFLKDQIQRLEERHEQNEKRCDDRIKKLELVVDEQDKQIDNLNREGITIARDIAILRADRHTMVDWINYHVSVMQQRKVPYLQPPASLSRELPTGQTQVTPTAEGRP